MEKEITRAEAVNEIRKSRGTMFSVTFVKKDQTVRQMTARLGVKKHLRGSGKPSTTFHIPRYITVFDMSKKGYRNINVNTILSISVNGNSYAVN